MLLPQLFPFVLSIYEDRFVTLKSLTLVAATLVVLPQFAYAKDALLSQNEADAVVVKFQNDYADCFNRRDSKAMATLLTENATMQNEGKVTQGRDKIESMVSGLMAKLAPGTKLEDTSLVSQCVAPNVIVSQGTSKRTVPDAEPIFMYFARVLVKQKGKWMLAATQLAKPSTPPPADHN